MGWHVKAIPGNRGQTSKGQPQSSGCAPLDLGLCHEVDVRRVKPWDYIALQTNELGVDDRLARKLGAVLESNLSNYPRAAVVVMKDNP